MRLARPGSWWARNRYDEHKLERSRRRYAGEEKVHYCVAKAGVKMVGPLFLLFACIMLLVMGPMILKLAQQSD